MPVRVVTLQQPAPESRLIFGGQESTQPEANSGSRDNERQAETSGSAAADRSGRRDVVSEVAGSCQTERQNQGGEREGEHVDAAEVCDPFPTEDPSTPDANSTETAPDAVSPQGHQHPAAPNNGANTFAKDDVTKACTVKTEMHLGDQVKVASEALADKGEMLPSLQTNVVAKPFLAKPEAQHVVDQIKVAKLEVARRNFQHKAEPIFNTAGVEHEANANIGNEPASRIAAFSAEEPRTPDANASSRETAPNAAPPQSNQHPAASPKKTAELGLACHIVPVGDGTSYVCKTCNMDFRSRSGYRKHVAERSTRLRNYL
jgi:hypothetical protein